MKSICGINCKECEYGENGINPEIIIYKKR